jgi:type IV secretory pathway TraG/TraD family ATPase VirD4
MTLWQSYEMIENAHGMAEAESIRNASRTKVFLSGQGLRASKELEEWLGRSEYTDSEGNTKIRPLMLSEEIRLMPSDEAIILSGNMKPMRVNVVPYYMDPLLELRTKIPSIKPINCRVPKSVPLVKL